MTDKKDLRGGIAKMREVAQLLTGWADDLEGSLETAKKKKVAADKAVAADAAPAAEASVPAAQAVPAAEPVASAEPPAPPSTDEVRAVLAAKCAAGFKAQVEAVINSFGAAKLSGVAPEHYPALLEMVADLGGEDHAG
jgi:hypothetical protein